MYSIFGGYNNLKPAITEGFETVDKAEKEFHKKNSSDIMNKQSYMRMVLDDQDNPVGGDLKDFWMKVPGEYAVKYTVLAKIDGKHEALSQYDDWNTAKAKYESMLGSNIDVKNEVIVTIIDSVGNVLKKRYWNKAVVVDE